MASFIIAVAVLSYARNKITKPSVWNNIINEEDENGW
jgi:hypothetical protein